MNGEEQILQAVDSEVSVPLKPPYVNLPKSRADTVRTGTLKLRFPDQCAWCGSESVSGLRQVQIRWDNPGYRSRADRLVMEGASLALGGALGGTVGAATAYTMLKPQDVAKIKGVTLNLSVPHCADHGKTSHEGIIGLVDAGLSTGVCRIKVRAGEYGRIVARMNDPTLCLPSLDDLVWPNRCMVCGTPDPGEWYQANVEGSTAPQGESAKVPLCADDLQRFKRAAKANKNIMLTSLLVGVGLGGLTLMLEEMGISMHLVCCSAVGLGGMLLSYGALVTMAARAIGVEQIAGWKPIRITMEDGQYLVRFHDARVAEAVRQVNGLIEGE
jgi:hypothetical protein